MTEVTEFVGLFGVYQLDVSLFFSVFLQLFLIGLGAAILVTFIVSASLLVLKAILHLAGRG